MSYHLRFPVENWPKHVKNYIKSYQNALNTLAPDIFRDEMAAPITLYTHSTDDSLPTTIY